MKRFLLVSVFLLSLLPSFSAQAAQIATCTCFCGVQGQGAAIVPGEFSGQECVTHCAENNATFVACATDTSQYPVNNPRCFDKAACERQGGILDDNPASQPLECPNGYFYCYPGPGEPATLSVAIGQTTQVVDIGEYLNAVYTYGLGIATTIAIVFLMIGGVQYVLASGSGDTAKAKGRIRGAVVGLVLLLFCYAILYTVNPQLTMLNVPQFPMVKRIEFLTGQQSCEFLLGTYKKGPLTGQPYPNSPYAATATAPATPYTLDNNGENTVDGPFGEEWCGSTAIVVKDPQGSDLAGDVSCQYSACDEPGERCIGVGMQAKCMKCQELAISNSEGITVSESVCASLEIPDTVDGNLQVEHDYECVYTHDPALLISGWIVTPAGLAYNSIALIAEYFGWTEEEHNLVEGGACAYMDVDCTNINTCEDYNKVPVSTSVLTTTLDWTADGTDPLFGTAISIKNVCTLNPCRSEDKPGLSNCQVSDGTLYDSCVTGAIQRTGTYIPPSSP